MKGGNEAKTHYWVVDRFEGELAVVEVDGDMFLDIPRWLLPADAGEGDWVALEIGRRDGAQATIHARIDTEATEHARTEAARLLEQLRDKDPGGDIVL